MEYGFCYLGAIPLRHSPSHTSEMVSQLLFGDAFQIIEKQAYWAKIKIQFDGYSGWISNKQFFYITETEYDEISSWDRFVMKPHAFIYHNDKRMPVFMGSCLPPKSNFALSNHTFSFHEQGTDPFVTSIESIAFMYEGTPYLWGGRTPMGIDCSGFVQQVFKMNHVPLPRDASQQAMHGNTVDSFQNARKNDLLFFSNEEEQIVHVGIYMGNMRAVHSSGHVKIDHIDENGIWNYEINAYSHSLSLIKRIYD